MYHVYTSDSDALDLDVGMQITEKVSEQTWTLQQPITLPFLFEKPLLTYLVAAAKLWDGKV